MYIVLYSYIYIYVYVCIYIYIHVSELFGGFSTPPEKYEFVNWDDDVPNIWEKQLKDMFHSTNQKRYQPSFLAGYV